MKIYIDILLIGNFLITELCLKLVSKLTRTVYSNKRMILAGTINALCSLAIILIPNNSTEILLLHLFKLFVSLSVIFAASGITRVSLLIKHYIIYLITDLILCGTFIFFWEVTGCQVILVRNGMIYLNIPIWLIIICTVISYIILTIYDSITSISFAKQKQYYAELTVGDLCFTLPAVCDSGNRLKDCFSGRSVVVFSSSRIYNILGLDKEQNYPGIGVHLVPYNTVSGSGIMPVSKTADVNIISSDGVRTRVCCAAGFAKSDGKERAVFDPRLIL